MTEDAGAVQRITEMIAWGRLDPRAGLPMIITRIGFGGVTYWRSESTVNGRYLWRITPRGSD